MRSTTAPRCSRSPGTAAAAWPGAVPGRGSASASSRGSLGSSSSGARCSAPHHSRPRGREGGEKAWDTMCLPGRRRVRSVHHDTCLRSFPQCSTPSAVGTTCLLLWAENQKEEATLRRRFAPEDVPYVPDETGKRWHVLGRRACGDHVVVDEALGCALPRWAVGMRVSGHDVEVTPALPG